MRTYGAKKVEPTVSLFRKCFAKLFSRNYAIFLIQVQRLQANPSQVVIFGQR